MAAGARHLRSFYTGQVDDIPVNYNGDEGNYRMFGAICVSLTRQNGQPDVCKTVESFSALHKPSGWNVIFSVGFVNPGGRGFGRQRLRDSLG